MNTRILIAVLAAFGLLVSCARIEPHPMDMTQAVQSAKTSADHGALAKHYEDAAREMQAKVEEHKKLLGEYEAKSYLYGKQAQNLKAHCQSLIRLYAQAAAENMNMAGSHRQMAAAAKE